MSEKVWLSTYPKEVSPSYEYPKQNLAQFLIETAQKYPKKKALYFLGTTMTYEELLIRTYQFANALKNIGIRKGDRVSIMLPNSPQAIISYYGSLMIGAIVVQTNPTYVERELEYQLNDSDAKIIIALDLLYKRVQRVIPQTNVKYQIFTSIKDYLPFPKNILYPLKVKKDGLSMDVTYSDTIYSFARLLKTTSSTPSMIELDPMKDLALLQYTGGTTGVSKGVMLTHYNLVANTLQTRAWCYKSEEAKEKYLAALPFFHVFGMTVLMNLSMKMAGELVLLPKFDIDMALKMIDKQKPTIFPGAPTMYISLINHPEVKKYDLSSVNICISGAAPLPGDVQETFEQLTGGRLTEGYGLTETSPVTHANTIWEKRKLGSIGIPFPDTEAKVVDPETGEDVDNGQIGELVIRGPQVMLGYWKKTEETSQAIRNGWFYTGDMATMDHDGFFYIIDRKKDLIIAGGFNIYPRDIEEVLFDHPNIIDAVVIGVPDEYRGETVKAFLVLKEGTMLGEEEIDSFCRERLASYKVPRIYEFRDSLPKTLIGKTLRRVLIEEEKENQRSNGNV
ncbi:long-chain-fatty-acid--CoA ligase [Halalkalibacter hemicellulosilyticus]|uniref:Long-chain-fatty-acid-CoA ligase n=1 Tax=Halalkalibacter hemicellulosilyticusJCM 9152 TaxID=1236971 RepID=W4QMI5_9BACI|nr:long-chain fatty acid--CoA ligase [Halalkalibacter hemicellulosilyticus]GAE32544.1 long-chain-fatty-acid-CoA ligase [Halalkalibacter hemicellulosilyticusJCM 9152]